jgi:hypothetical protein
MKKFLLKTALESNVFLGEDVVADRALRLP